MAALLCKLATLLALAVAVTAQTTYTSLANNYEVKLIYPDRSERALCDPMLPSCVPPVSIPDGASIVIEYRPNNGQLNASSTITLEACYTLPYTVNRAWRKPSNTISADKQCATPNGAIATGLAPQGNYTWTPGPNTPGADYYIIALETCSNGQYCGMGKSAGNYTIIPIDSRPSWLMALVGVFCACGPIALAAFFFGERHMKKNK